MTPSQERRLLQMAVAIAGLVPVLGGLAGVAGGIALFQSDSPDYVTFDSHFRYLSGLLVGIGLLFWSLVPRIETAGRIFQALTFVVVVGGLARFASLVADGAPSRLMIGALVMELVVTPLLCAWQMRIARRS